MCVSVPTRLHARGLYMHVVCTCMWFVFWFKIMDKPKPKKRYSLNKVLTAQQKDLLNSRLFTINSCIPSEFNRTLCPLDHLDHWKATGFKLFLLYVGPAILKDILDDKRYKHFPEIIK